MESRNKLPDSFEDFALDIQEPSIKVCTVDNGRVGLSIYCGRTSYIVTMEAAKADTLAEELVAVVGKAVKEHAVVDPRETWEENRIREDAAEAKAREDQHADERWLAEGGP